MDLHSPLGVFHHAGHDSPSLPHILSHSPSAYLMQDSAGVDGVERRVLDEEPAVKSGEMTLGGRRKRRGSIGASMVDGEKEEKKGVVYRKDKLKMTEMNEKKLREQGGDNKVG